VANEKLAFSLEEELRADGQGELKRKIQAQLSAQITEIDKSLNAGLSPQEYSNLDQVKAGLQSAFIVIEKIWQQFHKDKG